METKSFHLLTPVPSDVLQKLHQQGRKIVLVHGKLESPNWIYEEEWERGADLRRALRKEDPEEAALYAAIEREEWAERTPYVSIPKPSDIQSASAHVWNSHRDTEAPDSDYDEID